MTEKQIEKAREVFRQYVADDGLKAQYDGMTAYEVSKRILEASENEETRQEIEDYEKSHSACCDFIITADGRCALCKEVCTSQYDAK